MAQITFITRGYKQDTEVFINSVQSQFTQFNNIKDGNNQGSFRENWGIRPIQLWEVFFRDNEKQEVFQSVYNNLQLGGHKYKDSKSQLGLKMLSKALQTKPIPENIVKNYKDPLKDPNNLKWVIMKNMETIPVGWRPDVIKTEMI